MPAAAVPPSPAPWPGGAQLGPFGEPRGGVAGGLWADPPGPGGWGDGGSSGSPPGHRFPTAPLIFLWVGVEKLTCGQGGL